MAVLIKSIPEDILYLAPRLRQADVTELKAMTGMKADEGLMASFNSSLPDFTKTIFIADKQVGIFGLSPSAVIGIAYVWMVGTPDLSLLKKDLIIQTKKELQHMTNAFPILTNVVYSKNTVHIKWLHHLGFKFLRRYENFGYNKDSCFFHFIYHDTPIDILDVIGSNKGAK